LPVGNNTGWQKNYFLEVQQLPCSIAFTCSIDAALELAGD
jgi:hypothetical protein